MAGTLLDRLSIAVPARAPENLQHSPPRLRAAVKGLFCIKEPKTSLNKRACYDLITTASSTAPVIESLARSGAMIARKEPLYAVDLDIPFNPRGDGYQSPAGSSSTSSRSAAAVAACGWIDCGVGADTSGSGRWPALVKASGSFAHHIISRIVEAWILPTLSSTPHASSLGSCAISREP